jgi:chemotaxis receptor (MCP) glutamine deamidase CheD
MHFKLFGGAEIFERIGENQKTGSASGIGFLNLFLLSDLLRANKIRW